MCGLKSFCLGACRQLNFALSSYHSKRKHLDFMRHHVSEASLCETAVQKIINIYNGSGGSCSRGGLKTISPLAPLSFLSEKECRRIRGKFMYHSTCCFMRWTIGEASGPDLQFLSVSLPYTCQKHPRAYNFSAVFGAGVALSPGPRRENIWDAKNYRQALWRQGNNGCIAQWKTKQNRNHIK